MESNWIREKYIIIWIIISCKIQLKLDIDKNKAAEKSIFTRELQEHTFSINSIQVVEQDKSITMLVNMNFMN